MGTKPNSPIFSNSNTHPYQTHLARELFRTTNLLTLTNLDSSLNQYSLSRATDLTFSDNNTLTPLVLNIFSVKPLAPISNLETLLCEDLKYTPKLTLDKSLTRVLNTNLNPNTINTSGVSHTFSHNVFNLENSTNFLKQTR